MEYKIRKSIRQLGKLLLRGGLLLLVLFLILGSIYAGLDPYDNQIVPNVCVGGIDVGGMTMEEAYRTLKEASDSVLEGTVLTVTLPEETLHLSPADTKVTLRTWQAVLAACKVGRIGGQSHTIWLEPYLKLDKTYVRDVLAAYAEQYDTDVTPSRYELTGPAPDLEIENQSESNRPQTLALTMGLPTARLDQEDAFLQIMAVYDSAFSAAAQGKYAAEDFQVNILEEPEVPDLQEIYDDVYIAPVDDALDMEKYEVIPGAYGYRFDLDAAQKRMDQAVFGETLSIPMEFVEPEIFGDDVYFRDVLGYCETRHTDDKNRNHNLTLACQSMDGLILQPWEVFSYNDTLGQRTKEKGYLRAGAYSGWELVQSYGGGICQGSTTIYGAALHADLEIVHRKNHGYTVGYAEPGLDATVNWGGPDFQFRNNTHFPIRIAAEVSDGFVKVTILGTEERDYYVEMETEVKWGKSTIYATSYKCKYDRKTDQLISRELEAKSNYMR